jgi:transcriptional regulator with XRE-family HTH domain
MNQEKIGKLIKNIREKNNLTQSELANQLGVTYQAVSKWENGKNIPDIAILKEISEKYHVDINELLDVDSKKKKDNKIYLILIIILFVLIIGFIYFNKNNDFNFKTITTACDTFKISGSIAYSNAKSSIYISNIDYCGGEDNTVYDKITCTLYEMHDKEEIIISDGSYDKNTNINLEDYLKSVQFKVDNYQTSCKTFVNDELYIKIEAQKVDKIITYKIPLTLNNNCN